MMVPSSLINDIKLGLQQLSDPNLMAREIMTKSLCDLDPADPLTKLYLDLISEEIDRRISLHEIIISGNSVAAEETYVNDNPAG